MRNPNSAYTNPPRLVGLRLASLEPISEAELKNHWKISGPKAACGFSYLAFPGKAFADVIDPTAVKATRERHRAISNIGFCDGHVESIKQEKLWERTDENLRRWNNDHEPHRNLIQ